jgi:hypothetical protein
VAAQNNLPVNETAKRLRCGTMEALELYFQKNSQARAIAEQNKNIRPASNSARENSRTQAIMTIPVVVHLVLPAADMAKVTEADVIWQINKMNEDFSGLNGDSTNAALFYAERGHSQIRFCLAKQDANGNPTNGIDRVTSSITNFSDVTVSDLKHASLCGADAWDPTRYFNIWVAKSTELVGIATLPGTGPANEQGIAIALDGFSNNPAYVTPAFNRGRTAVHETGHYLGLYHIWDEAGCTTSDFRQLSGSCLVAGPDIVGSASDTTVGDTPNQDRATFGCFNGVKVDACRATSPGIQYQNFMDYTDDACYSMFTRLQVKRMEYVLINCRASLLNSNGCLPVPQFTNDAQLLAILNPGLGVCGFPGSTTFCAGSTITPTVIVRNNGTEVITSLKIFTQLDGSAPTLYNWTGSLIPYGETLISLPSFTAPASGSHTLKIYTADPNGKPDQRMGNDTLSVTFTIIAVNALTSIEEGFTNPAFPPPGWRISNPNIDMTWQRNATIGRKSPGSAWFNDWQNATNNRYDDLLTPNFTYSNVDSVFLYFQLSTVTWSYPGITSEPIDTLSILVSKDCGNTFTAVYKKWGEDLQTINNSNWPQTAEFFPNSPFQWRRDSVNLGSFLGASEPQFQVAFRFHGNFENNIFIDDVVLFTKTLPQALKQQGYLILPTITNSQFAVWHYQQPANLRSILIYNAGGQLVWKKEYGGNADKYIPVNMSEKAAGVYIVRLLYDDATRNVSQKIIKY